MKSARDILTKELEILKTEVEQVNGKNSELGENISVKIGEISKLKLELEDFQNMRTNFERLSTTTEEMKKEFIEKDLEIKKYQSEINFFTENEIQYKSKIEELKQTSNELGKLFIH